MDLINKPIIRIHDLWKSYHVLRVLKGLSLDIAEGQITIILGKSGVGKSVLLRLISGLEIPDKGDIHIDDVPLSTLSGKKRHKHTQQIGMLFQSSALFDSMSIEENVAFALRNHPESCCTEKAIIEAVDTALEAVGLQGYQKKNPAQLSGGQKRRAALARLIVYRPKILLFDEPTTGLDPITARQIASLIKKTQRSINSTAIVVTHDLSTARAIGDFFALHNEGKITVSGTKDVFFSSEDPFLKEFIEDFQP